jgi:hypothetical protein
MESVLVPLVPLADPRRRAGRELDTVDGDGLADTRRLPNSRAMRLTVAAGIVVIFSVASSVLMTMLAQLRRKQCAPAPLRIIGSDNRRIARPGSSLVLTARSAAS